MSASSPANRNRFRLSDLIYDSTYRAKSLQVLTLLLVACVFVWLINNTVQNMGELGKPISFRFLFEPAGYDINQRLIPYTADDSHLRAALVGLGNTLLVAVMGCLTATVLGVLIGVARLSKNKSVARLMRAYVEIFRNVPLLLWLLFIFAIITEMLPPPDAFRGDAASAHMILGDSVAITNRGIYFPAVTLSRDLDVLQLFGNAMPWGWLLVFGAVVASILGHLGLSKFANKSQLRTGKRPSVLPLQLVVWVAPVALVLWWLGAGLEYPELRGFNFRGGLTMRNSLVALWLALSLYTAAFIAEIVRAGILSVSQGQSEAAAALGLPSGRTMRLVVLPQALRVIIPPLISNYLNLTKNSSLAIAVGYMDLTGTLMGISLNQTGRELETILIGMSLYLTISISISILMNWYNASTQLKER